MHSISSNRILGMMFKELALYTRDTSVIRLVLIMPLMQIFVFGFVLNTTPKHLPTIIMDHDKTAVTRELISRLHFTDYFNILAHDYTVGQSKAALDNATANIIITIPPKWTASFLHGQGKHINFELDATDPISSSQASYALDHIISIMRKQLPMYKSVSREPSLVSTTVHSMYNGHLITRYGIIPPLIGIILTTTLINLTAISIVNERESGTMEMLLTTPINPLEVLLGKLLPNIFIGYAQIFITLAISVLVLAIPFNGSLLGFLLVSFPFVVTNLSLGLVFSVTAKSQLEATTASIMILLPSILLSGTIFPIHGMPWWAVIISYILPATYYTKICRAVFLKGTSIFALWQNIIPLLILMTLTISLALRYFKVKLD